MQKQATNPSRINQAGLNFRIICMLKDKLESQFSIMDTFSAFLCDYDKINKYDREGLANMFKLLVKEQTRILDDLEQEIKQDNDYIRFRAQEILYMINSNVPVSMINNVYQIIAGLEKHISIVGAVNAPEDVELLKRLKTKTERGNKMNTQSRIIECREGDTIILPVLNDRYLDIPVRLKDRNGKVVSEKNYIMRVTKGAKLQTVTK